MCVAERIVMTNNIQTHSFSYSSQIFQGASFNGRHVKEESSLSVNTPSALREPFSEKVYAQEGDDNYNAEMDTNGDGKVTYDEYMAYCEKNAVSQYKVNPGLTVADKLQNAETHIQSLRPLNIGKALSTYSSSDIHLPVSFVDNRV